jgi:tRNA 2-thiocytidine biosynthesis protein TtcA
MRPGGRDDILETFFLNMFFGGKLKGMPAKLVSDDGKHMVIRPMAYVKVKEADTERYAEVKGFPMIPRDLCGSQENLQRKQIKGLMREWEQKYSGRGENIFSSLSTVVPSHLTTVLRLVVHKTVIPEGLSHHNVVPADAHCRPE